MSAVLIPSPVYTEPEGESVAERIWRQNHEDMAFYNLSGAQRYTKRLNAASASGPRYYEDAAKRELKRNDARMHIEALLSRNVKIPALLLELARAEGIL